MGDHNVKKMGKLWDCETADKYKLRSRNESEEKLIQCRFANCRVITTPLVNFQMPRWRHQEHDRLLDHQ